VKPVIKAIETWYKGYGFRSRLEARWAVFFDACGIKWEYEQEGYVLSDGQLYLPDFNLPGLGVYAEVKSPVGDISKPKQFVADSGNLLVILRDVPSLDFYDLHLPPDDENTDMDNYCIPVFFGPISSKGGVVIQLLMEGPHSPWWDEKVSKWHFARSVSSWSEDVICELERVANTIESAVVASKSARFEFGETGRGRK
jgi:hypothetical protein